MKHNIKHMHCPKCDGSGWIEVSGDAHRSPGMIPCTWRPKCHICSDRGLYKAVNASGNSEWEICECQKTKPKPPPNTRSRAKDASQSSSRSAANAETNGSRSALSLKANTRATVTTSRPQGTQLSVNVDCSLVVNLCTNGESLYAQVVLNDFPVVGQSMQIAIPITYLTNSDGVNLLHGPRLRNLVKASANN
jgi:hypothetical protein